MRADTAERLSDETLAVQVAPTTARTPLEIELIDLLKHARAASKKSAAQRYLLHARSICESASVEAHTRIPSLHLEILTGLAKNADVAQQRKTLWDTALATGFRHLRTYGDAEFAALLFRRVVDFTQDPHSATTTRDCNSLLSRAKTHADELIASTELLDKAKLLTAKASLLRRMSRLQPTRKQEIDFSERAVRCAQKACEISDQSWFSTLEFANCLWHSAQFERNEEAFNRVLIRAEEYLRRSVEADRNRNNTNALAQFYRNTYQSMPFVLAYEEYARVEYNRDDYLRGSFLWAEGVLQLYYSDYPKETVDSYMAEADQLLEQTIDSGYGDARHIVALAFLKAAQGDATAGLEVLRILQPVNGELSWSEIAEHICHIGDDRGALAKGLALGITSAAIWNKLGTYAKRFLNDQDLAIKMYRVALRLNPSSAVAMTNLANALLELGTKDGLHEAQRLISKAASCADRRFRWWRPVREAIVNSLREEGSTPPRPLVRAPTRLNSLAELRKAYTVLEQSTDKQSRGYALERLVAKLIDICIGNCSPAYRTQQVWADGSVAQIDAAFCYLDTQYFRVETKWKNDPVTPSEIVLFRDKLDVTGVGGLFISVNGFTREAVVKAAALRGEREMLLMDGQELKHVLNGCPSFDEALRVKRQHFLIKSNPYHRVTPVPQDEVD